MSARVQTVTKTGVRRRCGLLPYYFDRFLRYGNTLFSYFILAAGGVGSRDRGAAVHATSNSRQVSEIRGRSFRPLPFLTT